MAEFEVGGIVYKNKKLSAMAQLDLMLDLSPLMAGLTGLFRSESEKNIPDDEQEPEPLGKAKLAEEARKLEIASQIATAIAAMPREKTHSLIATCMNSCERKMPSGKGWARIWNEAAHQPMFDDIGLMEIGGIVMSVLQDNFANFLPGAD